MPTIPKPSSMLTNYLKIAHRNLIRNKAFSFINIFGLAIGLTTCLLIMLYILDETSYDKHHKDVDRLYRVSFRMPDGTIWVSGSAPLAGGLKMDFPQVEQAVRVVKVPDMGVLLKVGQDANRRQFYETNGYYVDSTFFRIFTYDFLYGDPHTALDRPNSAVLSETVAAKLFGNVNPIGKSVNVGLSFDESPYTVQGVFKEGKKSHIPANFFLSMHNSNVGIWVQNMTNWATNNVFYTYIKLREGTDRIAFEKQLPAFMDRRAGADLKAQGNTKKALFLQPMKDIYLYSNFDNEIAPHGNIKFLYILGSIAVFILLIASINFMNLSTARAGERAREVGVRKVMGAERGSLIRQFLGESFMLCLIALTLALALSWMLLPFFNDLAGKNMKLFTEPKLIGWLVGLTLFTGLLSGLYPAFYLSAFRPVAVLKGKLVNNYSATIIRKGLVVLQFSISICLIIGVIVIWKQLQFVRNEQLGFEKEQQIVLPLRSVDAVKNYEALKGELLKNSNVRMVSCGSSYPGISNINDMLFYAEGKTKDEFVDISMATVDHDYLETLGFKLLYGRTFSKDPRTDSTSMILNETALKKLGYDPHTAVGRTIHYDWENAHHTVQIIGVVKDFHSESLHNEIRPYGFATSFLGDKHGYVIARLKTAGYSGLIAKVGKTWNTINPGTPFEYSFLDQDFQKNYEREERTSQIVSYFTLVAILVACLGLFGLSAFSAEQRVKEIGIRKVLGASVLNLTGLLSKDFIRLVLLSIVIASPLAWYGMTKWLQDFAYKIRIEWWMFAVAGILAVLIALMTVSFQAIRAALANPAKSLKAE